jgi:hypothetical protein
MVPQSFAREPIISRILGHNRRPTVPGVLDPDNGALRMVVGRLFGVCVVWMIVWAVVKTWPLAAWDEHSVRSSFPGLFFYGIIWVFFWAHKRWAPMFDSESWGLTNANEGDTKVMNSRTGPVALVTEMLANHQPPRTGSPCRSIYSGRSSVLLQCLKYP